MFQRLERLGLCDGPGLYTRLVGAYNNRCLSCEDQIHTDKVPRSECNQDGRLPCVKCGINICKECRVTPREYCSRYPPCRRPHYSDNMETSNIICYCHPCDQVIGAREEKEFCSCDRYTRWICHACRVREIDELSVCNILSLVKETVDFKAPL